MIYLKDNIFSVFGKVCAEDTLKEKTIQYLYGEIQKKRYTRKRQLGLAIACSLFVTLLFFSGFYTIYITPNAYIDVDINPSIELTLNRFGKVIRSNAYNDDGTELLKGISVKNKNYEEAIKKLLDAMELAGYFKQEKQLSVTVQAKGSKQESNILDGLKKSIDTCNGEHHHNAVADIIAVTEQVKKEAKQEQLSPAKYLAIQDLLEANVNINMEECRGHSVEELRQRLQEHCSEHKIDDSSHQECQGEGHCSHQNNGNCYGSKIDNEEAEIQ